MSSLIRFILRKFWRQLEYAKRGSVSPDQPTVVLSSSEHIDDWSWRYFSAATTTQLLPTTPTLGTRTDGVWMTRYTRSFAEKFYSPIGCRPLGVPTFWKTVVGRRHDPDEKRRFCQLGGRLLTVAETIVFATDLMRLKIRAVRAGRPMTNPFNGFLTSEEQLIRFYAFYPGKGHGSYDGTGHGCFDVQYLSRRPIMSAVDRTRLMRTHLVVSDFTTKHNFITERNKHSVIPILYTI